MSRDFQNLVVFCMFSNKLVQHQLIFVQLLTLTGTTTAPVACLVQRGYTRLYIDFIRYTNPSDQKSTNIKCDADGSLCDLSMEICVSQPNSR